MHGPADQQEMQQVMDKAHADHQQRQSDAEQMMCGPQVGDEHDPMKGGPGGGGGS